MQWLRMLAVWAIACPASAASWNVVRSAHFEVWSDAPAETAPSVDADLERLHAFFVRQLGLSPRGIVRVVCFAIEREFVDYRIRPGAAGFSLTTPAREYIVLPAGGRESLHVAAHEYAHLLIHSSGAKPPQWFAEGIAEVVSSIRFGERNSLIGGDLPGRSQLLKSARWMTPSELFGLDPKGALENSARESLFYSESWALAEMLLVSPAYAPRFSALLAMMANGSDSQSAIEGVYHTTIGAVFRDLHERQERGPLPMPLPPMEEVAAGAARIDQASAFASLSMLADLRYAAGDRARAEAQYRALAEERPQDPGIAATLGLIALDRRDTARGIEEWGKAIALGITDADLCFRYAALAEDRGLPQETVRAALERAAALRPDFDEVQFRLGLMDRNEGHAGAALSRFHAMRAPAPERAWQYYSVLADTYLDLGDRAGAKQAAARARQFASNDRERARAAQLAYLAATELTVEIVADAQGRGRFHTVRVPVDAPPKNPFIQAGDDAHSEQASLDRVECSDSGIRVLVTTANGPLALSVPDPTRVQIRNGGGVKFEFTCGPQQGRPVLVEYAAPGTLRGLELMSPPR